VTLRSTVEEIAALALDGTPIVCVDTCSILDLQRGLVRDDVNALMRTQALNLVEDVEAGRVISVVTRQIEWEVDANRPFAVESAAKGLKNLLDMVSKAEQVAEVFEVLTARADLSHLVAHAGHARALVDRWWSASRWIDERDELKVRAADRVNLAIAPAKPGKQSYKDCLITETYLDLIETVRKGGSSSKVVFLSSNIDDYAVSKTDHTLHPSLVDAFKRLGMTYATNPGQARKDMGFVGRT
jgi:hypothetical protein